MPTLMDTITQNSGALAGTQAPMTDTTGQVQTLMQAKSGKALTGQPQASNLGEASAVAGTQAQLNAQAPSINAQTQSNDIAAQQQQNSYQAQQAQIAQSSKFNTAQNQVQVQQLMQSVAQSGESLDSDKNKAQLEQTAFLMSMQDSKYTNQLQDIGNKQRLDNAANFQQAQQQMAFGSSLALVQQQLGQNDILDMSNEDFQKAISSMSIDQITQMAQLDMQDMQTQANLKMGLQQYNVQIGATASGLQAQSQGVQQLVRAGVQGAMAAPAAATPTTPTAPSNATNATTPGTNASTFTGSPT